MIVQPGLVYGPGDTAQTGAFIAQVVRGQTATGPGRRRGLLGARRGRRVGARAGDEPGRARREPTCWPVRGATLADGLQRVAAIAGTKGPMVLPTGVVRAVAGVAGRARSRRTPAAGLRRRDDARVGLATYLGTPAKAERDLGWHARDLDTGLRETVAALRG